MYAKLQKWFFALFILGILWGVLLIDKPVYEGLADPIKEIKKLASAMKKIPEDLKKVSSVVTKIPKDIKGVASSVKKIPADIKNKAVQITKKVTKLEKDVTNLGKKAVSELKKTGKQVENTAKSEFGKVTKKALEVEKKVERVYEKEKKAATEVIFKIGESFVAIGSYLTCGFDKMVNLRYCMLWYGLDIVGIMCYAPFSFLFWISECQEYETAIWDMVEEFDSMVHDITDIHLFHYSKSIVDTCYSCKTKKFPKF